MSEKGPRPPHPSQAQGGARAGAELPPDRADLPVGLSVLPVLGIEVSAEGVGRHYGARASGGLLDAWLVAPGDGATVPGVDVREVPLLMSSPEATQALARAALEAAGV